MPNRSVSSDFLLSGALDDGPYSPDGPGSRSSFKAVLHSYHLNCLKLDISSDLHLAKRI